MKKIFLLFSCLLILHALFAQKDFEGYIVYKVTQQTNRQAVIENPDEIKVWFGHGRILINSVKGETEDFLLIMPDSGKSYSLDKRSKTYEVKRLKVKKSAMDFSKEVIAGHIATPVYSAGNPLFGSFGMNSVIWFSDSLLFNVPEKYEGNEELLMVYKNHIMLKAKVSMDFGYMNSYNEGDSEDSDTADGNYFILEAAKVIPEPIAPAFFTVPTDFTKTTLSTTPDTAFVNIDTVITKQIQEKTPPPSTPKAPSRPPAKSKVNKGTLRK
jgi:hypothetical protein